MIHCDQCSHHYFATGARIRGRKGVASSARAKSLRKSRFENDEAEEDDDFIDDGSVDESDSVAADMVRQSAKAVRNRRSFADDLNMCTMCRQMRVVLRRLLGLDDE
jgi:hypothetical protein